MRNFDFVLLKTVFSSALVAVIQTPDDFEGTLLRILAAGGDNAGRAALAGAWLGAHLGIETIPGTGIEKLRDRDRIQPAPKVFVSTTVLVT